MRPPTSRPEHPTGTGVPAGEGARLDGAGADAARPEGAGTPTRRAVLTALAAVAGASLSGCGLRRERSGPALPFVPVREVDPRAAAVYAEWRRVGVAADAARRVAETPGSSLAAVAATLADLHLRQRDALAARLTDLGEDTAERDRLDATLGDASAELDALGSSPALPVAEAQGLSADQLGALDRIPDDEAPLLLSLRVQRAVALPLVGATPPAWTTPTVASQGEAARLVGVFRSAEYGLGVATARATTQARPRLAVPLAWLTAARLVLQQQTGDLGSGPPLGYALPFPVTDDASAVRLAQVVLTNVTDDTMAGIATAYGNPAARFGALSLAAVAEGHARDLGASLRPFPGLHAT